MKLSIHLVAMPWPAWAFPSVAISALKAYVDQVFEKRVATHTHSGHVGVMLELDGERGIDFHESYLRVGEDLYFFANYGRFRSKTLKKPLPLAKLLSEFNRRHPVGSRTNFRVEKKITRKVVDELDAATRRFIDRNIGPTLDADALNVVGFTINFDQIYSSIFAANYLKARYPRHRFLFLFGGWGGGSPMVVELLQRNGLDGLIVIGEGEKKLELLIRKLEELPDSTDPPSIIAQSAEAVSGVYDVRKPPDLFVRQDKHYRSQFASIDSLPLPDFEEFMATFRGGLSAAAHERLRDWVHLMLEGSRGCFAHCDFCNMNYQWEGFRKSSAEVVARKVREICDRYGVRWIQFVDNVCDTWAERYAELLLEERSKVAAMMELRAHHPERFWTKLSLSGVYQIQIGVEAIAPPLLKEIGKGTKVIQNLCAQKYLRELGIRSVSNLITHHPRSTPADVRETRRVLEQIPHLDVLNPVIFTMDIGSPLYERMPEKDRRRLKRFVLRPIHPSVDADLVSFGYSLPGEEFCGCPGEWDKFNDWYTRFLADPMTRASTLEVRRYPSGRLHVVDRRHGRSLEHWLEGDDAIVLDACHAGLKLEAIVKQTGLPEDRVRKALQSLLRSELVLETEGFHLSLPLRPRDELVANTLSPQLNPLEKSRAAG